MSDNEIPEPPRPNALEVARNLADYEPECNPYNLRDDLETSFPTERAENGSAELSTGERLLQTAIVHGDYEAIKELDKMFVRYELQGVKMVNIAQELNISVPSARKLFNGYKERKRKQIERLEVNDILSSSLSSLDEYRAEVWAIATDERFISNPKIRLNALKLAANMEMMKLDSLEKNRFYERKGYRPIDPEIDGSKRPGFIMNLLNYVVSGEPVESSDGQYKELEEGIIDAQVDETT